MMNASRILNPRSQPELHFVGLIVTALTLTASIGILALEFRLGFLR